MIWTWQARLEQWVRDLITYRRRRDEARAALVKADKERVMAQLRRAVLAGGRH